MKLQDLKLLRQNALTATRTVLEANPTLGSISSGETRPQLAASKREHPALLDPELGPAISVAQTDLLAERAGLSTKMRERLAEQGVRIGTLDNARIDALVESGALPKRRASAFRAAAASFQLVDQDDGIFQVLPSTAPEQLVALDQGDWTKLLAQVESPLAPQDHAAYLRRKTANWFPTQALKHHLNAEEHPAAQVAVGLAGDVLDGLALHKAGYSSPRQVARANPAALAQASGLGPDRVQAIQQTAQSIAGSLGAIAGAIAAELQQGPKGVGSAAGHAKSWFAELPGFDALFGEQSYCDCEACASILGAAAYFVDLMRFVDEHATQAVFTGAREDHVLALRSRRPDLWELQLSCENVNTLIPTLQIVVEVLERLVLTETGSSVDPSDQEAVDAALYATLLPAAVDSFTQPHTLAVTEINALLGWWEHSLDSVGQVLLLDRQTRARMRLGLSQAQADVLVYAERRRARLDTLYQVTWGADYGPQDVQDLLSSMGVSRDELGRLLSARFPGGAMRIVSERRDADSIQNDIERLHDADKVSLDRLHRFVRLWRASGLEIEALDLALTALAELGRSDDIDGPALADLAAILRRMEHLDLDLEQALCLWAPIPIHPTEPEGESLLDRLFNLDRFVVLGGSYPTTRTYTHPSLGEWTDLESALDHARLLAATGVDEEGLEALVLGLAEPLGLDLDAGSVAFPLSRANLSLLYRHALLADSLDLDPAELFSLLSLAQGPILDAEALSAALDLHDWSTWSLSDLEAITGLESLDAESAVDAMIVELESSLSFESASLAVLEGLSETQAQSFLEALTGAESTADGWILNADFDPSAIPSPPTGASVDPIELHQALLTRHATTLLRSVLPASVDCDSEALDGLLAVLGADLGDHQDALLGGDRSGLEALTTSLWRLSLLLSDARFDAETLLDLAATPTLLGLSDPSAPTVDDAHHIALYLDLHPGDAQALHDALDAWDAGYADSDPEALGIALGSNPTLAQGLARVLPTQGSALVDLSALKQAVSLAEELGLAADTLAQLSDSDPATLARASASLLAALRAASEDTTAFDEAWEPIRDALLEARRDALVDWLLHSGAPQFDSATDLYDATLLDTQVSGCARTSRIVQATNSLQLYVQRILLGLERSPSDAPDPVSLDVDLIPTAEWEWRRQYRLWQANRLIFLFPESYLLPSLRDNKTALFERIESELLSSDITEEAVEQAYATYLAGFEELAELQIGGACREIDEHARTDVLHLFATTTADPPRWYYRRVENTRHALSEDDRSVRWRAWEPLDLKIPGREVSPIVHDGRLHLFWHRYETKPVQAFEDGSSKFRGYRHQMRVEYARLKADSTWTAPQELTLDGAPFEAAHPGVIDDYKVTRGFDSLSVLGFELPIPDADKIGPLYAELAHNEPIDNYTLRGVGWDRIHVSKGNRILLRCRDFQTISGVDLYTKSLGPRIFTRDHGDLDYGVPAKDPAQALIAWLLSLGASDLTFSSDRILWSRPEADARGLYYGDPQIPLMENEVWAFIHARQETVDHYASTMKAYPDGSEDPWWDPVVTAYIKTGMERNLVGTFKEDAGIRLLPITGSPQDMVIAYQNELFLLQDGARADGRFHIQRLGTSLAGGLSKTLFTSGVDGLLSLQTQLGLGEDTVVGSTGLPAFKIDADVVHDATCSGQVDWTGPMGVYLRELYLHLPMLLAQHLDDAGDFEAGRRWWNVVFDPTAKAHASDSDDTQRAWRYREFRELAPDTLRDRLTDPTALADYAEDPFNPHAIARTRLTAYQKACVYGLVDNLLGTGDQLFTQFTRESVAEATLYYVMAESILGERPAQVGECGETAGSRTYGGLEDKLGSSELLLEVEHWLMGTKWESFVSRRQAGRAGGVSRKIALQSLRGATPTKATAGKAQLGSLKLAGLLGTKAQAGKVTQGKHTQRPGPGSWAPGADFATQLELVFCVPNDDKMLARWDSVADRLYKLRNCMDIDGVKRQLALFAPFIDPMLLARAAAMGLDLGDVVAGLSSGVPPLRFPVVLELARRHASLVQGFGAALYAALERRDAQELAQLQQVHQSDALALATKSREQQLSVAQYAVSALEQRVASAQARLDHYTGLLDTGLSELETNQALMRLRASAGRSRAANLGLAASILRLIPNLGSPTAITFGGKQLGAAAEAIAGHENAYAAANDSEATAMGLFATWTRRQEGWSFSQAQAERELAELEPQLAAAELRAEIAERALDAHTQRIEQVDEVLELFERRFTNSELLDWRAQQLQTLFREAWQVALSSAQMAQAAYRFERDDDRSFLSAALWDATRAGLLSGERLQLALAQMEQRYAQTTTRRLELSQTLALSQLDPQALIELRETGACEFTLAERHFDLHYPGHYARRLRAVRLTLPCVTGPYTSVSATLTLLDSQIRPEPTTGDAGLQSVSAGVGSAVATSTAQGDAGVFELSFRSERTLPFEGAGALSSWRLELPKRFRTFDYRSITDVLVDVSYEADADGVLREAVEAEDGVLASSLRADPSTRILSLRQDLSSTFQRLMRAAPGTSVDLEIGDQHLPGYLRGQPLTLDSAQWVLVVDDSPGAFSLSIDGSAASFSTGSDYGGLPTATASLSGPVRGTRSLSLDDAGDLADATGAWTADPDKLHDLLLVLQYTVD